MKKALLLCASHNDLGLLRALRKLGYYIIVTGNIPGLIGEKYADQYIQEDYSDKEAVLSIAKREQIDVICSCCNDFGVYTAAYVAGKLGLPGYDSYETTLLLHNKDKFKKFAKEHEIMSPKTADFSDFEAALQYVKQINYPIIIKPVDASAGNGVSKIPDITAAEQGLRYAFEKSRERHIVIEEYVEGTQHGFCTYLINQKVRACCSNNEYSILNPFRVEIDTFPADNFDVVKEILIHEIEKIAGILKLKDGIFHLQYIFKDGKPQIIEVMRRVLGNMYSVPGNQLTGIDWDYWEIRARCGLSCEDFPQAVKQEGFYAYKTILAEENGCIASITIPEEYKKYIIDQCILKGSGDMVQNYKSEPVGFLFFLFSSQEEMKNVLIENYANSIVRIG